MILVRIKRNENEQIVVEKRQYKSMEYVDLRVYFRPTEDDEFVPTRKGITFKTELVDKVIEALQTVKTTQEVVL